MRLAKYIAGSGICSRRAAEDLIAQRRVTLNGKIVTDPALDVAPDSLIEADGKLVQSGQALKPLYIVFHKPVGVLSVMTDERESGPTLSEFVSTPIRVFPVGRLDKDSSGLMLLTNDGELTHRLTHPRHKIQKEYHLRLNRSLLKHDLRKLARGVEVDGRKVVIDRLVEFKKQRVALTIYEGRKRIVRRMLGHLGFKIIELKRVRIGPLSLHHLGVGKWRKLRSDEISRLKMAVGLEQNGGMLNKKSQVKKAGSSRKN